jgi:outer membrane immunogenic protein
MNRLVPLAFAAALVAPAAFAGTAAAPVVEPTISVPEAPPAATTTNWTGAYGGITLGFGRTSWRDGTGDDSGRSSDSNFGAAGHVGYNLDMGNWVAGGEVALAPGLDQTVGDREVKWGAAARLRAGPKLGPGGNTWGFGSLGLTHVRHDAVDGDDRQSANGWLIGVGASHLLQDNVIVTGEINHARFGGESSFRSTGASVGVSFRF